MDALPSAASAAHPSLAQSSHQAAMQPLAAADIDLDLLSVKLDEQARNNKSELLDFVLAFKGKLLREAGEQRKAELAAAGQSLAAKQAEVVALEEQLELERRRVKQASGVLLKVCCALAEAKHFARHQRLLALALYAWRNFTRYQRRVKDNMRSAVFHYDSTKLKKRVLEFWRSTANLEYRTRVNTVIAGRTEAAKREAWAVAQQQITDLQRALDAAHAELDDERQARAQVEEDTRRAFMRGVCALNIEAIAVMKRGSQNGALPSTNPPTYPAMPMKAVPGAAADVAQQPYQQIPSYRPGSAAAASVQADWPTSPDAAGELVAPQPQMQVDSNVQPLNASGHPDHSPPEPSQVHVRPASVSAHATPSHVSQSEGSSAAPMQRRSVNSSLLPTLSDAATPINTPFATLQRPAQGQLPSMPMPSDEVAGTLAALRALTAGSQSAPPTPFQQLHGATGAATHTPMPAAENTAASYYHARRPSSSGGMRPALGLQGPGATADAPQPRTGIPAPAMRHRGQATVTHPTLGGKAGSKQE